MGIQINGVTDSITAVDGSLSLTGAELASVGGINVSGVVTATTYIVGSGSTSAPSITPSGDSNTGIFFPSPDTIAFGEGGAEAARIDSSGRFGLGTASPSTLCHLNSASSSAVYLRAENTGGYALFGVDGSGNAYAGAESNDAFGLVTNGSYRMYITAAGLVGVGDTAPGQKLVLRDSGDVYLQIQKTGVNGLYLGSESSIGVIASDNPIVFRVGSAPSATERARIDSSGRLLVGTSSAPSSGDPSFAKLTVAGSGTGDAYLNITRSLASTSIANNSPIGSIFFTESSGGIYAQVQALCDGTSSSTSDLPGRLVFATTADGASSPTEQLRITSDRYVRLASGTGGIQFNGDTADANALDDYEEGTFTVEMQYNSGGSWFGVGFSNTPQTTGYYVKVGKLVTCYYYSTDFQVSSGVGAPARFGGFPFAAANVTEGYVTGTVTHVTCFQQANQNLYLAPNSTNAIPIQQTSTSTNTWNNTSNVYIMWSITYRSAS